MKRRLSARLPELRPPKEKAALVFGESGKAETSSDTQVEGGKYGLGAQQKIAIKPRSELMRKRSANR